MKVDNSREGILKRLRAKVAEGKPIVGRPSRNNVGKVPLYPVGVDTAKELIYARLRIDEAGPGFCHFPERRDDEYFRQLTAERQVIRYHKGFPVRTWVKSRTRNEALDVRVYAVAAFAIINTNIDSIARRFYASIQKAKALPEQVEVPKHAPLVRQTKPKRGGFANSWR